MTLLQTIAPAPAPTSVPAAPPAEVRRDELPDITRPDAGTVLVGRWRVGTPERQRAAVDATIAAWERTAWPEGMLSLSCLLGTDGDTILDYAQWTSDEAHHRFVREQRPALVRGIDDAVPGTERAGLDRYRLYRSYVPGGAPVHGAERLGTTRRVGSIVVVNVELEGPDHERQRAWIDTVIDVLSSEAEPPAGLVAAHFHASTDGRRVLNYAEWVSEGAHRDALERSGRGNVGTSPEWDRVRSFPGIARNDDVRRYNLYRSVARAAGQP